VRVHIAAAGHLSSRPENASSKCVLFFRSVAAISFSSDETKSGGLRVVITYYLHMRLAEHDRRRRQNARLPPRARINISQVTPPPHHSSSSVGCVYMRVSIIHLLYYCRHYSMCIVSLADCRVRVPIYDCQEDGSGRFCTEETRLPPLRIMHLYTRSRVPIPRTKWNNTHTYAISTGG